MKIGYNKILWKIKSHEAKLTRTNDMQSMTFLMVAPIVFNCSCRNDGGIMGIKLWLSKKAPDLHPIAHDERIIYRCFSFISFGGNSSYWVRTMAANEHCEWQICILIHIVSSNFVGAANAIEYLLRPQRWICVDCDLWRKNYTQMGVSSIKSCRDFDGMWEPISATLLNQASFGWPHSLICP